MEIERKPLHCRNKHSNAYDFDKLIESCSQLKKYVFVNEFGSMTIDFFNPMAVRALNKALLMSYYEISYWNIPKDALCSPIPGRADYIHYLSDLKNKDGKSLSDVACKGLDVGVGSNCIYPIIGTHEYNWTFVGADINEESLKNARKIVTSNPRLSHKVDLRLQTNCMNKFSGIIKDDEYFDFTMCNPPFHSSSEQAAYNSLRKFKSLKKGKASKAVLNFGGVSNELWCDGGELKFLRDMIKESSKFKKQVGWFTSYVANEKDLKPLYEDLKKNNVAEYKTVEMSQGTKKSRFIAWRF